ncbi:MAG: helix-turn-helix transcriptional regulator [Candidatus Paceibacterota bacterium]
MEVSIISNLAHLRAKAKMTQEELAKEIGITRQTIISIERGNYTPSVLLALKLAGYFKCKVEDIFNISYES